MARFGRDMAVYATADLLGSSIGLVLSPLFTRLFSPEQYGAQAALAAVWTFAGLAQFGGMDSAYPMFRSRTFAADDRRRLVTTASTVAILSALAVTGLFALVGLTTGWITKFAQVDRIELFGYVLTLAPGAIMAWLLCLLRFDRQAMAFARVSLTGRFAAALLLVPVLMSVKQENRLIAGFLVTAGVTAAAVFLGWREVRRMGWLLFDRSRFDRVEAKAMLRFGLVLVPASALYATSTVVDRLLVTWFCGPTETAVLSLALRLGAVAVMLRTWFALVWDPQLIEWIAAIPPQELIERLRRAQGLIGGAGFGLVGLATLWTQPVVTILYPSSYWAVVPIVPWIVFGVAVSALSLVAVATITIAKQPKICLPVYAVGLVANVSAGFWSVPRFGAIGAVGGAVVGEVAILLCWVFVGKSYLRNLPLSWTRPLVWLAIGGMGIWTYRPGFLFPVYVDVERTLLSLGVLVVGGLPHGMAWLRSR